MAAGRADRPARCAGPETVADGDILALAIARTNADSRNGAQLRYLAAGPQGGALMRHAALRDAPTPAARRTVRRPGDSHGARGALRRAFQSVQAGGNRTGLADRFLRPGGAAPGCPVPIWAGRPPDRRLPATGPCPIADPPTAFPISAPFDRFLVMADTGPHPVRLRDLRSDRRPAAAMAVAGLQDAGLSHRSIETACDPPTRFDNARFHLDLVGAPCAALRVRTELDDLIETFGNSEGRVRQADLATMPDLLVALPESAHAAPAQRRDIDTACNPVKADYQRDSRSGSPPEIRSAGSPLDAPRSGAAGRRSEKKDRPISPHPGPGLDSARQARSLRPCTTRKISSSGCILQPSR